MTAAADRWRARVDGPLCGVVLLIALGYRLYALTGDMQFDPVIYAQNAYNVLTGTFSFRTDSWYAHRFTVFLPVVPCFALLGVGPISSRLWPLALSLVQVALVYHLGRRLLGRATGLLAALFVALAPLDVIASTTLQPDIIMAAFLTAAAVCWVLALEDGHAGNRALPMLSGICFALAVLARENAALLVVFYAGTALWRRTRAGALLWAVAGGLLVILPVLVLYAVQTGDPFFRFGVLADTYSGSVMQEGTRLSFYPGLLVHVRRHVTGVAAPLFALGLVGAILRPDRPRVWLLWWAVPMLLYLQFGSMSATHFLPVLKRERFLTPLTAPLSLLAAAVLLDVVPWALGRLRPRLDPARRGRIGGLILGGVLAVLALNSFQIVRAERARGMRTYDAFRSVVRVLRGRPDLPVLFDHWRTGHRFSYYLGFEEGADLYRGGDDRARMRHPGAFGPSRLGYVCWYPDPGQLPKALIVLDDDALERVRTSLSAKATYAPGEIPGYAYAPPAAWTLLGRFGTFRVYQSPG